jgi:Cro/C1-type HTH DNA-binding domain
MGQFQMAFRRMIRWRLNEVMAEKRVKGIELAEALGIDPNSVSRMRKRTTMPRLTPEWDLPFSRLPARRSIDLCR